MKRSDHDKRMNALAHKVSDVLEGEDLHDVASVCALVTTWALFDAYQTGEARRKALAITIEWMQTQMKRMEDYERAT